MGKHKKHKRSSSSSSSSCSSDEEWKHHGLSKQEKKMRKKWKKQMKKGKLPPGSVPPWKAPGYQMPAEEEGDEAYAEWFKDCVEDAEEEGDNKESGAESEGDHEGDNEEEHEEEHEEKKSEEEEHKDEDQASEKDEEKHEDDDESEHKEKAESQDEGEDEEHKKKDDHDSSSKAGEGSGGDGGELESLAADTGKVTLDGTAELYRPSLRPADNFSAEADATALREAMKGTGTEEAAIIEVIGKRSNSQRQTIKNIYKTMFGKDLEEDLRSELSGDLRETIMALFQCPAAYDAWSLHDAMEGLGTKDSTLIEILCTRSNAQIKEIVSVYKEMFGTELEQDIIGDTSGHFERLLVSCCQGNRTELSEEELWRAHREGPECLVDRDLAREDAQRLFAAGEQKWGTDESTFLQILALRHFYQLQATFEEYQKIANKDILESIIDEMSGKLETGFKAIVRVARSRPQYFADKLHKAMDRAGTNDSTLIRIVVSRSEIDLGDVKEAYQAAYGRTLAEAIASDTSGDYKNLLLAIVGE